MRMVLVVACVVALMSTVASASAGDNRVDAGQPIAPAATAFSPADVRLLAAPAPFSNPFLTARDAHASYLLEIDSNRLLARFRSEAGLEPKAPGYDGWEKDTIGGHTLGHYLTACAKMYAGTGDDRFKARVDSIVAELAECQRKNTEAGLPGYVAAIPGGKKALAEVAKGDIRSKGFDLNGIWVPWYTLHKEMAGLRDAHAYCESKQALEVWRGLADYSLSIVGSLTPDQLRRMLRCEHGGMNELAADLFALTGEQKYLDLAHRFNDHQVLDPLADQKDILPGLHSNTQIPKVIGAARQYELSGDPRMGDAAKFFWSTMTSHHSYVTGGNSMNEYLGPRDVLAARLEGNTTETCNTYNMLKLSLHVHAWSADSGVMDYYERALYNHILASKDPSGPGVCYFLPLRPGAAKQFQRPFEDFTCCVGSGMENHASYGDAIYSHHDAPDIAGEKALLVNLFIASEVDWKSGGVRLRQETAFPDEDSTTLRLTCDKPAEFSLKVRCPAWLAGAPVIEVNQKAIPVARAKAGSYATIKRTWATGDVVKIRLPMELRVAPAPDDPDRIAILYGPVVLAGDMGKGETDIATTPHVVMELANVGDWVKRAPPTSLAFRTSQAVRPADLDLIPLYRVGAQHYTVYWKRLSPAQWTIRQAEIERVEAAKRALAARTVDFFQPGEMQPERDHGFDGVFTNAGEHKGRRWRDADVRGWFAFTMKVPEGAGATLVCTYWGSDTGGREFDVLVDGAVIATQTLDSNKPDEFFDVEYPLSAQMLAGKKEIRVKLAGKPDKRTGGLFGCRVVRAGEHRP
ncbi:MAG: beta-L-arabinofuranosidase domain-containing protein [Planctomycetota bacterium]